MMRNSNSRDQGFQLYLSDIPGRSMVYFEKFDKRESETEYWFSRRQKEGTPDRTMWWYLKGNNSFCC